MLRRSWFKKRFRNKGEILVFNGNPNLIPGSLREKSLFFHQQIQLLGKLKLTKNPGKFIIFQRQNFIALRIGNGKAEVARAQAAVQIQRAGLAGQQSFVGNFQDLPVMGSNSAQRSGSILPSKNRKNFQKD